MEPLANMLANLAIHVPPIQPHRNYYNKEYCDIENYGIDKVDTLTKRVKKNIARQYYDHTLIIDIKWALDIYYKNICLDIDNELYSDFTEQDRKDFIDFCDILIYMRNLIRENADILHCFYMKLYANWMTLSEKIYSISENYGTIEERE
jgi:hypothetical protein